jgi:hypothetical protein
MPMSSAFNAVLISWGMVAAAAGMNPSRAADWPQ